METGKIYQQYFEVLNDIPQLVTDSEANVGKYSYKYLSLAQLLQALRPVFAKHQLGFMQKVEYSAQEERPAIATVKTIIFNTEGSLEIGAYPVQVSADPQAMGSAVTYARRYSLYAALNIYPEKDDDGAGAAAYGNVSHISQQQADEIVRYCKAHDMRKPYPIISRALGHNIQNLSQIRAEDFETVKAALMKAAEQ